MTGRRTRKTPGFARRILNWSLPASEARFVLDDLERRFQSICRDRSVLAGRMWYWRQALAAVRVRGLWPAGPSLRPSGATLGQRLSRVGASLRVSVRSLSRRPGLAVVSILALGLGIGATTTAFSVVWGTVLRGLPFEQADRLVHFERQNLSLDQLSLPVTPHDYVEWRESQSSFVDLGAFVEAVAQIPNENGPPARYSGVFVSSNTFELLRALPLLGRTFTLDEDRAGGPPVAVISHGMWTGHFGGDPDILGRDVMLNGRPTAVVGVMPEGFGFPVAEQVWLPLRLDLATTERGEGRLDVFGRLRDGVRLAEARAEMDGIAARLALEYPESNAGIQPSMQTFQQEYVGDDFSRTVYRMLAGGILVLLVACANVANLLLARARSRSRELAVRAALGGGRARILGVLLAEAGVLTVAGALLGVGLAVLGVAWFEASGTQAGVFPLPHGTAPLFWWDVRVDAVSLLFVVAVTGLTALAAGILPGLHGAGADPGATLRSQSRGNAGSRANRWSRRLVVGEVALTTGLLVVAGLTLRSVLAATSASTPVPTQNIMTAWVDLPLEAMGVSESRYGDHESRLRFAQDLERALEEAPGVSSAAVVTQVPTQRPRTATFSLLGDGHGDESEQPSTWVSTVSSGFFDVFEVEAREGRVLASGDREATAPVAVVNESFAGRYFEGSSPVGRRLRLGAPDGAEPWLTIVGVVPDLWTNAREPAQHTVYVPMDQSGTPDPAIRLGRWGLRYLTLAVRAQGGTEEAAARIRDTVFRIDPDIPVYRVRSMDQIAEQSTGRYRIWSRFYAGFAAVALFLAAVGLYGVMAYGVGARTAEIGIRRALGAPRTRVLISVLQAGMRQIAIGAGLGVLVALWLSRGMDRMLFQVDAADPLVFAVVLGLIGLVGLAASLIPAGRAARIEPVDALRVE